MPVFAFVDSAGFCAGIARGEDPICPPGHRLEPVSEPLAIALQHGPGAFLAADGRWRLLPPALMRRWPAALGLRDEALLEERTRIESARAALAASGALEEAGLLQEPDESSCPWPPDCKRRAWLEPSEIQPGLIVRLMEPTEIETLTALVAASNLYGGPEMSLRAQIESWWWNPCCWPVVVTWREQVIEIEYYLFDEGDPTRVEVRSTIHLMHERSHWFWRECEAPIFAALLDAGVTKMVSRVRTDLREWIDTLKRLYGAAEVSREQGGFATLRFDVRRALAGCTGWPQRRALGPAWRWRDGLLELREGTVDDLPAARACLATAWGNRRRLAEVERMIEERWELDRAALLLGSEGGVLTDVFVVRERTPTLASHATLAPWRLHSPAQGLLRKASALWQQAAGYDETSSIVPEWMWTHPHFAVHYRRIGGHVVTKHPGYGEPWIEVRGRIADLLARPDSEWGACLP